MKVAIVGGGIAGLGAAWELCSDTEVTVFESERLGGRILTETFEGRAVECGPDAFITRTPDALVLCREVGVGELVAPQAGRALLWLRERLRDLPEALLLGAPSKLLPLVRSGILPPAGLVRAAGDLVLPRRRLGDDLSVRELVAGRFGGSVADLLVEPLLGGIHAGRIDRLSARVTAPQIFAAAERSRSLLVGLRQIGATPPSGPLFLTPIAGLGSLVHCLVAALRERGTRFRMARVDSVTDVAGRVEVGGEPFDAVVLSTGAEQSARLLGVAAPEGLGGISAASVAIVTMGFPELELPAGASGFLVPRTEGRLMTACSFGSSKWPHWAAPGRTVLRASVGRDGDERFDQLDDEGLVDRVVEEVRSALGVRDHPDTWRVNRWPNSFPQYRVGHASLVESVKVVLARDLPHVTLCGSSYEGAGIPACIASGRSAARALRSSVTQRA